MPHSNRPETLTWYDGLVGGQLSLSIIAENAPTTPQKRGVNANTQLLTPPPTGDFRETVRFKLPSDSPVKSKRRRLHVKNEDESALAEYADLNDPDYSSDESVLGESPISSSPEKRNSLNLDPPSHIDERSAPGDAENTTSVQPIELFVTSDAIEPFPFMELPKVVRKKVYGFLLVVPGLICVRQNHTSYHNEEKAFLFAETRQLLPGIAYALPQIAVNNFKIRFSRFQYTNAGILRVSKEVYTEAKAVMYGENDFEIVCPNMEMDPPPDFRLQLFPRGCQNHVRSLSIRVRALYPLKWLLNGGYGEIKNAYKGLDTLNIIFEVGNGSRDFGKVFSKKKDELWVSYVKRLHATIKTEIFAGKNVKTLPIWLNFRVLFNGEAYDDLSEPTTHNINVDLGRGDVSPADAAEERLRRYYIKRGFPEAFEMFKKGGR